MTTGPKVAVASRSFSRHPQLRAELLNEFPGATFNETGRQLFGDDLIAFLRGHERAITALEKLDEPTLAALPELRVVAKFGVGLDMLDLAAMERRGIRLGWSAGVNRRSVAELVIAFAISLLRFVPQTSGLLRAGEWRPEIGRQLSGRTVGIIGCGHIGKELVALLRPFGCRFLAHDIRDYPEFYRRNGVEAMALEPLLRTAEIVTLHIPLDASTENFLSAERLAWMKPEAVLINAARGGLVDEGALCERLAAGRLAGAAFDVFVSEPAANTDLTKLPNFLATPHIGGSTKEAVLAMGRAAIRGLTDAGSPMTVAGLE